jgi:hypothetical protein
MWARRWRSRRWAWGLVLALVFTPAALAQDFPTPDFNRELEVVETIKQLYAVVTYLAAERDEMGYAGQCEIGIRAVDNQIAIYGVPGKDDLKRAWTICYEIYLRLRPIEDPDAMDTPTPELRLDPYNLNPPQDAPPGYISIPSQ